ncbi:GNAT family N-acetyltransferase [Rubrobacter tropicus]|uniref:GNAT family N-acetyltransferase n=1 Tax=Rubrobacter tropicus TaxID=2653851 RepID=A0A6G8Q7Y0_9ACTN|nr:GNAT family protein [Rubrobacter tropicus]QIN82542.1 GNAT family N-acetyltransferase [Rubrobacter tropicus]
MKGSKPQPSAEVALNIVGERVALGPLREELLPLYGRWINDFGTMRMLGLPPGPVTAEKERDWYEQRSKAETDPMFTIYERETLRPIGNTALHGLDHRNRSASFGILIGDSDCRGKGYGTETTRLMLDYAFTALGLHNVLLTVFAYNPAGFRAYEKAGFREIGRRRESRLMGGKLWDEIYMDCLAPEFESPVLGRIFSPEASR